MSEQEFNIIFSNNLNKYIALSGHTQADIAKAIGVSTASVSNWCKGIKLPRMDKVDKLCAFFNIGRSDLMRDQDEKNPTSSDNRLTPEEEALVSNFRKLNKTGREKALDYASDLAEQEKYRQDAGSSSEQAM